MELFPPQPDLTLQISPPSIDQEENINLRFWRKTLDNSTANSPSSSSSMNKSKQINGFDLSLSNPSQYSSATNNNLHLHFHHHHNASLLHHQDNIPMLRPIKGIPIYQHTPNLPTNYYPFPFAPAHPQLCDSTPNPNNCFVPFGAGPGPATKSRFMARFPPKRSVRAPRMRWTTTLHARFVHAVELLGGHESMFVAFFLFLFCYASYFYLFNWWLLIYIDIVVLLVISEFSSPLLKQKVCFFLLNWINGTQVSSTIFSILNVTFC